MHISESAEATISKIPLQPDMPAVAGLRIALRPRVGRLQVGMAERPAPDDCVIEQGRARVFLSSAAATHLQDAELDVHKDDRGRLQFTISRGSERP